MPSLIFGHRQSSADFHGINLELLSNVVSFNWPTKENSTLSLTVHRNCQTHCKTERLSAHSIDCSGSGLAEFKAVSLKKWPWRRAWLQGLVWLSHRLKNTHTISPYHHYHVLDVLDVLEACWTPIRIFLPSHQDFKVFLRCLWVFTNSDAVVLHATSKVLSHVTPCTVGWIASGMGSGVQGCLLHHKETSPHDLEKSRGLSFHCISLHFFIFWMCKHQQTNLSEVLQAERMFRGKIGGRNCCF